MNLADYLLARIAATGCDKAFIVYGGAMTELADAFTRQSAMRYVVCQHEQACGFAAEGYAKAKGVPGCVIVTSGPGGGNIVTCLQNAYYDSVPLIAISGQVATNLMRRAGSGLRQNGFQEAPMAAIAKPITKWAGTLQHPCLGDPRKTIDYAIAMATRDRPGPVLIDFPSDIQRESV